MGKKRAVTKLASNSTTRQSTAPKGTGITREVTRKESKAEVVVATPLQDSLRALIDFEWPDDPVVPMGTQDPDEVSRVCRDSRDDAARNGLPFTDADEDWAVDQWRKYSALTERREHFIELCLRCYVFTVRLAKMGRLNVLAGLAGVDEAPMLLGPSALINYLPLQPTRSSKHALYPDAPGGNLVLGARLIWWCAASLDSIRSSVIPNAPDLAAVVDRHFSDGEEFGYGQGFFRHMFTQPFWMRVDEDGACSFRTEVVELITTAAMNVVDAAAKNIGESSGRNNSEDSSESLEEGLRDDMRFFQKGLEPLPLSPRHYKLMSLVWKKRRQRIPGDAVRATWEKPIEEDTWKDELYRLGNRLKPFEIRFSIKNEFVTVEYPVEYWDR